MLTVALTIGSAWITTSLHGATRFTVSGKIEAVTRNSQIALFADKPFYGPPNPRGDMTCEREQEYIVYGLGADHDPGDARRKEAGFGDLKSGQYVVVGYELVVEYILIYCAATRIDAHSAPSKPQSKKPAKHK